MSIEYGRFSQSDFANNFDRSFAGDLRFGELTLENNEIKIVILVPARLCRCRTNSSNDAENGKIFVECLLFLRSTRFGQVNGTPFGTPFLMHSTINLGGLTDADHGSTTLDEELHETGL